MGKQICNTCGKQMHLYNDQAWGKNGKYRRYICPLGHDKFVRYLWKDDKTKLLRKLRNSKTLKEKYNWSRDSGAGFIKEDINSVHLDGGTFTIVFNFLHKQQFKTGDLNLRETEEIIAFLEKKEREK